MEQTLSFTSDVRSDGSGSDFTIALQHPLSNVSGVKINSAYVGHGEPAIPDDTLMRVLEPLHYDAGTVTFTFDVPDAGAPPVVDVGTGVLSAPARTDVTSTVLTVSLPGTIATLAATGGDVTTGATPHAMHAWPSDGAQPVICNCSLNDCVLLLKDQTRVDDTTFTITHKRTSLTADTATPLSAGELATVASDIAGGWLRLVYPTLLVSEMPSVIQGILAAAGVPLVVSFDSSTGRIALSSHQHIFVAAGPERHIWNQLGLRWGTGWIAAGHYTFAPPSRPVKIPRGTFASPTAFATAVAATTRLEDITFNVTVAGRTLAVTATGEWTPISLASALTAQTTPYVTWAFAAGVLTATSRSAFTLSGVPAVLGFADGTYEGEVRGEVKRLRNARFVADGARVALRVEPGHAAVASDLTTNANAMVTGDTLLAHIESGGNEYWRILVAEFASGEADIDGDGIARDLGTLDVTTRGVGVSAVSLTTAYVERTRVGSPLTVGVFKSSHVLGFTRVFAEAPFIRAVTPLQTLPEPSILIRVFAGQELIGRRIHVISPDEEILISCRVISTGATIGYILDSPCAFRWDTPTTIKRFRVQLLRTDGTPVDTETVSSLTLSMLMPAEEDGSISCGS